MLNVESGIAKGRTGGTSGVTNEELERGMELHERRLAAIDERLGRLAAASESHDKRHRLRAWGGFARVGVRRPA